MHYFSIFSPLFSSYNNKSILSDKNLISKIVEILTALDRALDMRGLANNRMNILSRWYGQKHSKFRGPPILSIYPADVVDKILTYWRKRAGLKTTFKDFIKLFGILIGVEILQDGGWAMNCGIGRVCFIRGHGILPSSICSPSIHPLEIIIPECFKKVSYD